MKYSAHNVLNGTISRIALGDVYSEITLTLKGGSTLVAAIANDSLYDLELTGGMPAYAIIKATSVIIGVNLHAAVFSARNVFHGTVAGIKEGPVSAEIGLDIGNGDLLNSIITSESAVKLCLKPGDRACALFKASSVMIGVPVGEGVEV